MIFVIHKQIFDYMLLFLSYVDKYQGSGTTYLSQLNLTGLYIQFVIFSTSLFCLKDVFYKDQQIALMVTLYTVGMMFQSMTEVMGEFFRVSMYFSIFGIILLPKALNYRFNYLSKLIVKTVVFLVFVLYFVFVIGKNEYIIPYSFFFEVY